MKYIKTRNRGFTLIEIIITLGVIAILIGSILVGSQKSLQYYNNKEVESSKNNILSFINNSKLYCRNKFTNGTIMFDTSNNLLKFKVGLRLIDILALPKGFKLNTVQVHNGVNSMQIDKYGFTSDACTISFNDKYNKAYYITVCVGTCYCEIK